MNNRMDRRSFLKRVSVTIVVLAIPKRFRRETPGTKLDLNTDTVGEHGGYYVPPEFRDSILKLARDNQAIRGPSITVHSDDKQWQRITRAKGNDDNGDA